jgi:hypothetical protein
MVLLRAYRAVWTLSLGNTSQAERHGTGVKQIRSPLGPPLYAEAQLWGEASEAGLREEAGEEDGGPARAVGHQVEAQQIQPRLPGLWLSTHQSQSGIVSSAALAHKRQCMK